MKIGSPKISKCIDKNFEDAYNENDYNNCIFSNNIDKNIIIRNSIFDSCI